MVMSSNIRAISRRTGFSTATVSCALRGVGRVAPATRLTIEAAAKELGYQPIPVLSKALSLIRQPNSERYRETIGYIMEFPMNNKAPYFQELIHRFAEERARSLGYNIESFVVGGSPKQQRQVSRILLARGIRGLIILPRLQHRMPRLHFEWSQFAAVEIGRTLWSPSDLHRIERAIYIELFEAFHRLKKGGYRRIGMAVEPIEDKNRRGVYTAAYLTSQQRLPPRQRIPPLSAFGEWNKKTFTNWMKKYKPDVLVTHATHLLLPWLEAMGLQVPNDISVFSCNVLTSSLSGLRANLQGLGEGAVEMLSLLLDKNEIGLPDKPRTWSVRDDWQEGESLDRFLAFDKALHLPPSS